MGAYRGLWAPGHTAPALLNCPEGKKADDRLKENSPMDFSWSDQQRELLDAVGRFAKEQLDYDVIENERNSVFNRDSWKK